MFYGSVAQCVLFGRVLTENATSTREDMTSYVEIAFFLSTKNETVFTKYGASSSPSDYYDWCLTMLNSGLPPPARYFALRFFVNFWFIFGLKQAPHLARSVRTALAYHSAIDNAPGRKKHGLSQLDPHFVLCSPTSSTPHFPCRFFDTNWGRSEKRLGVLVLSLSEQHDRAFSSQCNVQVLALP